MENYNFVQELEINKKLFKKILEDSHKRHPTILTFITPNLQIFDIYRLIKLNQFASVGFDIFIYIFDSEDDKVNEQFNIILDKLLPSNKRIRHFSEISENIKKDKLYLDFINSIKPKDIWDLIKEKKGMCNLSFLNIQNFLIQCYLLKSKEHLPIDPDFILATAYFNKFLKFLYPLLSSNLPPIISLPELSIDYNICENPQKIQRLFVSKEITKRDIIFVREKILIPFTKIFNLDEKLFFDISVGLENLKKHFLKKTEMSDYFVSINDFKVVISALNSHLRRQIISIIDKNAGIRAEEIRVKINLENFLKYTLPNILGHLKILTKANLISKEKKRYFLKNKRIILDIPSSWFGYHK